MTLPLYMPKEIQMETPASGRELEHIHLSTYELSVAHRSIQASLFVGLSSVSYRFWGLSKNWFTTCLLFLIYQRIDYFPFEILDPFLPLLSPEWHLHLNGPMPP